ncbi:MAG: DUF222 domain-containing protein, partial [Actinophytocola sp.]|nr:DUF222 domain-containing protein [Actinophytocola sp.]
MKHMCEPFVDLPEDASPEAVPLATAFGLARMMWQREGEYLEQLAIYAAASGGEFDALEVAALFRISLRTAQQRLDLAVTLATRLPRTLAAVKAGRFDPYRASKIADATLSLSLEAAAIVEEEILDPGRGHAGRQVGSSVAADRGAGERRRPACVARAAGGAAAGGHVSDRGRVFRVDRARLSRAGPGGGETSGRDRPPTPRHRWCRRPHPRPTPQRCRPGP